MEYYWALAGRGKGVKLMGNVFVPEDIQEMLASKVNFTPCCSSFYSVFNTTSRQDTAHDHTNQMGDFLPPWVLVGYYPLTTAHMVWGSVDPHMGVYGVMFP